LVSRVPKVLVATVGFDEKFTIRALMRYQEEIEEFIGILSKPVEQRAAQAVDNIRGFIERYIRDRGRGIAYSFEEVDPSDPYTAISRLRRLFRPEKEYILNLSGGMRALVIEVLIAFTISRARGSIEIELENFTGKVAIDPRVLTAGPLSIDEERIVNTIKKLGKATYRDITRETGIPRATVFKHLSALKNRGIIAYQREGRTTYYTLTDIGRALSEP